MSSLLKIRAQRDTMSAIERRIADFVLDNAQLLRDYSSQQLANALEISQSSVVKFSQKLGYKGYPDLKYAVGLDVARSENGAETDGGHGTGGDAEAPLAGVLWGDKSSAEQETRLLNPPERVCAIAALLGQARTVSVVGLGQDGALARAFTLRLAQVGILAVYHFDPVLMPASLANAGERDVLMVFCEHGRHTTLCELARLFRSRGGKVVSITRHSANPLRAQADLPLLVSAHDDRAYVEQLLYQSALQHLLDQVFVLLCERAGERMRLLDQGSARMRRLLES